MTYNPDDPKVRRVLLPPSTEELLVNFNAESQLYVKVPLAKFERNKEALIAHAMGEISNLAEWHTAVRDPHAIVHVISNGDVVYEVPPILTRMPTVNPEHGYQTLSKAAADHERDFSRLPIAADNVLKRKLETYTRPVFIDDANRAMWIKLLKQLGVDVDASATTAAVEESTDTDGFTF